MSDFKFMKVLFSLTLLVIFSIPKKSLSQSGNIELVMEQISNLPIKKQVKVLEDSAWEYMRRDYEIAFNYSSKANEISKANKYDTGIAESCNTMGIIRRKQAKYDESFELLNQALKIWKEKNDLKNMSHALGNLANLTRAMGKNEDAISYAMQGLEIDIKRKDSTKMAMKYTALGNIAKAQGRYESAMNYYIESSRLDEMMKDSSNLSIDWSNIADMFFQIKQYDQAIQYYRKGLVYDKKKNNVLGQEINHSNMAGAFKEMNQFDSALLHYNMALVLAKKINDEIGLSEINVNLGALYFDQNEFKKSRNFYELSLKVANDINDQWYQASAYNGLGNVLVELGEINAGIDHLLRANQLATELTFSIVLIDSNQKLANAFLKKGSYEKAYSYLNQYVILNDSINSISTNTKIAELETKYETKKKEHQIVLLNTEKELQAAVIEGNRVGIIALVLFILSGLILAYWFFKRTHYRQELMLESEKTKFKEEQVKAVINSQEKERKRFAMDLHDDFGQLLSAMRLNVHRMKDAASDSSGEISEKSEKLIDNMYSSLKNIAFDLMPHALFEKGLEEALDELKDQINISNDLRLEVQSFGIKDKIQGDQKIALYRIIQEFMSNIIKYSDANKVNISITDLESGLSLLIEDDGSGFDLNAFKNGKGNGWKNIHSRLDLLGGEIEMDTMKGRRNTTISIDVPYSLEEQSAAA